MRVLPSSHGRSTRCLCRRHPANGGTRPSRQGRCHGARPPRGSRRPPANATPSSSRNMPAGSHRAADAAEGAAILARCSAAGQRDGQEPARLPASVQHRADPAAAGPASWALVQSPSQHAQTPPLPAEKAEAALLARSAAARQRAALARCQTAPAIARLKAWGSEDAAVARQRRAAGQPQLRAVSDRLAEALRALDQASVFATALAGDAPASHPVAARGDQPSEARPREPGPRPGRTPPIAWSP